MLCPKKQNSKTRLHAPATMRCAKVPKLSHSVGEGHTFSSSDYESPFASYDAQITTLKAREKAYKRQIATLTDKVKELLHFKNDTEVHKYCLNMKEKELEPIEMGRRIHAHLNEALVPFVSMMEAGKEQKYFTDKDVETITDSLHTFYDQFNKRLAMHELDRTIGPIFKCPISQSIFKDPVLLSDGLTYERATVETYFDRNLQNGEIRYKSPFTNLPLERPDLTTNRTIKQHIEAEAGKLSKLLKADNTRTINSTKTLMPIDIHNIIEASSHEDGDCSPVSPDYSPRSPEYSPYWRNYVSNSPDYTPILSDSEE